jgi:hypothetical protein
VAGSWLYVAFGDVLKIFQLKNVRDYRVIGQRSESISIDVQRALSTRYIY